MDIENIILTKTIAVWNFIRTLLMYERGNRCRSKVCDSNLVSVLTKNIRRVLYLHTFNSRTHTIINRPRFVDEWSDTNKYVITLYIYKKIRDMYRWPNVKMCTGMYKWINALKSECMFKTIAMLLAKKDWKSIAKRDYHYTWTSQRIPNKVDHIWFVSKKKKILHQQNYIFNKCTEIVCSATNCYHKRRNIIQLFFF